MFLQLKSEKQTMDLMPNQTEAAAKNRRCSAQPLCEGK